MKTFPCRASFGLLTALLLAAEPARAGDDIVKIQFLASTGADSNGTARARWRDKGDSVDFNVELEKLSAGTYELFVADVDRGDIQVDGTGEGEIEFENPLDPPKPLFDFAVFDQLIEIRQGATVFFSDTFAPGNGGGGGDDDGDDDFGSGGSGKTEVFMVNVGPDLNAKGRLRYEAKSGETRFEVKVEALDAGEYDVLVGGDVVGSFDTTGLFEVELDFRDPPDDNPSNDPGEQHLELTFDPLGKQVDVVQGETTFLTGILPGGSTGNAPKNPKQAAKDLGKKKGDALQVMLLDLGVLVGAQGKAELSQSGETEFEVEIEDVPDGDYDLLVGSVSRGTLTVAGGEGQLDFSTSPEGDELLLDFAVKGQLVQVALDDDPILALVFPLSVPAALGKFAKESSSDTKVKANLANAGVDLDTDGRLVWKQTKNARERLQVKVSDLPAGDYDVRVGGASRGTLTIPKDDGKAKVMFDSQPKGNALPLDFDVLGQTVQVVDGDEQVVLEVALD